MQVKDSRNHKVFKVTKYANTTTLRVGDSRKKADGSYENCYWDVLLVGNAQRDNGHLVKEGDRITINEGIAFIETFQEKRYGKVTAFRITIQEPYESNTTPRQDNIPDMPPPPAYESPGDEPF